MNEPSASPRDMGVGRDGNLLRRNVVVIGGYTFKDLLHSVHYGGSDDAGDVAR